jgi:hypothetical protein
LKKLFISYFIIELERNESNLRRDVGRSIFYLVFLSSTKLDLVLLNLDQK